jgi:hypothetical protein
MQLDDLVNTYLQLKDRKAAMKKVYTERVAPIDKKMADIEAQILKHFQETGQISAKTAYGTPYISLRESFTVADRDTYFEFVRQHEAWDMLESRANKTAVQAWKEEHGELPPGLNYRAERTVNIRSK